MAVFNSFVSISQSLPTTAYVKMIDIWMIFTMVFPFMEVTLHTIKHVLTTKALKVKKTGEGVK